MIYATISDMTQEERKEFEAYCKGVCYPATMWAYCSRYLEGEESLKLVTLGARDIYLCVLERTTNKE